MSEVISKQHAVELLGKILKDNGYSITSARKLVFDLLWGEEPQSIHELYAKADGRIDRASIYRTVDLYQQLNLVQRIIIGWKYKLELTDVFTHHHHHISCLDCGKVVSIKEDNEIESLIESFGKKYHITPERHQLEIQGYCEQCLVKRQTA